MWGMGCMFGGARFHSTIKCAVLSYKLGYFITAALLCPVFPVRLVHSDRLGLYIPLSKVYLNWPYYELTIL